MLVDPSIVYLSRVVIAVSQVQRDNQLAFNLTSALGMHKNVISCMKILCAANCTKYLNVVRNKLNDDWLCVFKKPRAVKYATLNYILKIMIYYIKWSRRMKHPLILNGLIRNVHFMKQTCKMCGRGRNLKK